MKSAKILNRKRVLTLLKNAFEYPLAIVEAPMGYGKTTAVRSFFAARKLEPKWITFRYSENSSSLFWNAFSEAVGIKDEETGKALLKIGFPADAARLDKALSLLNSIAFTKDFWVVLDDYQLSRNPELDQIILWIVREEISWLHFVIVTRDTTNLDFVELLSKGLCSVVSQNLLKFSEVEANAYCRMVSPNLSPSALQKIYEYTGGWISFLYLILLGNEQGIPIGISSTIEDLIEKALFSIYNTDIQNFLFQLSVMDEFTAAQAEFVTENKNAGQILKKLNRENAFVYYDEINKTYKIHAILLDFLQLRQNLSESEIRKLYERLGDWYLKDGNLSLAYGFLYRSGQWERILYLLNQPENIRDVLTRFDGSDEMFEQIPEEKLFQYPLAYLQHIFFCLIRGKSSWSKRLDELERYFQSPESATPDERDRILGEILIVRKFTLFNHLDKMIESNCKITRLLKGSPSYITLRNNNFTFGSPHYMYLYFREKGSFRALKNMLEQNIGYAGFSNGCGEGSNILAQAEYALETGELDEVEPYAVRAICKAKTKNQGGIILCAMFCLARLQIYQGKFECALKTLTEMEDLSENINFPTCYTTLDMCKGYLYSSLCQPEKIPFWLQTGDMSGATLYYRGIGFHYLVYGKAMLALGHYTELDARSDEFQKAFSQYGNQLGKIGNYIFQSAARYHLGNASSGIEILEKGLFEAQEDNLSTPFAEASDSILKMVEIIAEKYPQNEFFQKVLAECRRYERNIRSIPYKKEVLSPRELDILLLTAEGLTRKEISEHLVISEETVKTHLRNIYQKLEASGKIEAIKIARARGVLDKINQNP